MHRPARERGAGLRGAGAARAAPNSPERLAQASIHHL